jgi:outer membrane protein OmpA-like peptidoglycan-associated protein
MSEAVHVESKLRTAHAVRLRAALTAILGLGGADLVLLNLWAAPSLLTATDVSGAQSSEPTAVVAASPQAQKLLPRAIVTPTKPASTPQPKAMVKPLAAATPTATIAPAAATEMLSQAKVWFGSGNWWIGPHGRKTLLTALEQIQGDQRMVQVIGHADAAGTPETNLRISRERARAVALLLIESGLPAERIEIVARGEEDPSPDGNDRRVEIQLRGTQ